MIGFAIKNKLVIISDEVLDWFIKVHQDYIYNKNNGFNSTLKALQ